MTRLVCLASLPLWAALVLAATPAYAAMDAIHLGGRLQGFYLHQAAAPADLSETGSLASHRLRLETTAPLVPNLRGELAVEALARWQDLPAAEERLPRPPRRALDLAQTWNPSARQQRQLAVDRLALHYSAGPWELQLGRQAIGFGRIALASPLDFLAPFPPDALDSDIRPGVDALRLVRYAGLGGQLAATVVFGRSNRDHSVLATATHTQGGVDLLGLAGLLRERPVAGFGLAGSLGGLGLKGELTGFQGRNPGEAGGDLHPYFLQGALEAWYRFDSGLVLLAEFLHNGSGTRRPADYPAAVRAAAFQEGLTYLAGRDYLLLSPSMEVHPLVTAGALLIWNLHDQSLLLRPQCTVSLADNLSLLLFWSEPFGRGPMSSPLGPRPRSEFGVPGANGGFLLQYYF